MHTSPDQRHSSLVGPDLLASRAVADRAHNAQARQFVDEGFVVVENLVSESERAAINAEIPKFARNEYRVSNPVDVPPGATDDEAMKQILAIHFPHFVSPIMREVIQHPGIVAVLRNVTAAHLAHWDGSVKCMQSMLFAKPPGLQGQAWHQDERYIPTRDRSLIGAWIALDDANVSNGCLWVLPGSHRHGYLWPTGPHGRPDEFDSSDEANGFDDSMAVAVEVPAGSVVFFNGYLLHRSLRNRSDGYRRALVNHYCNAWSLLPWAATAGPPVSTYEIPTLDYRGIVAVGDDPYEDRGRPDDPDSVFLRPHLPTQSWPKSGAVDSAM